MSETDNNVVETLSSTTVSSSTQSGGEEKLAAPTKEASSVDRGSNTAAAGDSHKTESTTADKEKPRHPLSSRRSSHQEHNPQQHQGASSSPRKYSHPHQFQQQMAAASAGPLRKFFHRQQSYQPVPPQYQYVPQPQFQVPRRKPIYQRQQSLPTFYHAQQQHGQGFGGQSARPIPDQRRGSSGNVSFQLPRVPIQQQQQRQYQKFNSGASNNHYRRNSSGVIYQKFNGEESRQGNGPRKISAPTGPAASIKMPSSTSTPRWSESVTNGSDYESGEFDLEEPFSESDEDETPAEREARRRRQAKPARLLPVPTRRIRTLSGMIPAVGYSPVWGGPTMCLNCLEFFDLPDQTSEYVQHLLDKHKIVVTDIELIVDLKRYVEYWRHRFGKEPIEKIFPLVTPNEGDTLFGKVDNYYLMSEKLPEDRQLRERLALRRLEEVLSCQQREREDHTFERQCLFCRYRTRGNRAKLVHHLYTVHRLNLGSPENLVFVSEYLDSLEEKLNRNECIYCEKIFTDYITLAEHMRKKQHREVNPKNNYYDRFYVINYLELGKKWLEVLAEDFEDNTPAFADSDEEEEEDSWNEWQEDAEGETMAVCLFCDDSFEDAPKILDHMKESHQYDLKKIFEDDHFGFYDRIKLINYIRKLSHEFICFACGMDDLHSSPALKKHLSTGDHLLLPVKREKWDKEEYLIPTYENDHLLCLLDDILELNDDDFGTFATNGASAPETHETILEVNENEEKEAARNDPIMNGEQDEGTKEDASHEQQSSALNADVVVVIPEDLPEWKDSALNDPELREQLQ